MWIYILIAIIVIIFIYGFIIYNSFVNLNNKVDEAFSTMDVYLKKRWDLIPNLVETIKGYQNHENETLTEIINLRNTTYDSMSTDKKLKTNEELASRTSKLMMLVESYPELKANANFLSLSRDLTKVEDEIANARKYYNAVVKMYNIKVEKFPNNIFAKILGFKSKNMFLVNQDERENVKVELSR